MWGWDFVQDNNVPNDLNGHGTHMAGVIAAAWNDEGIAGTANGAKIVPIRFMDADGFGASSDLIESIDYAMVRGVNIINASFGGTIVPAAVRNRFEQVQQNGIWVVAAAGNEGSNNDTHPIYPASLGLTNIISVGAVRANDSVAGFSNFGAESVDLFAPGEGILTTSRGSGYAPSTGTSIAAAMTSGALALLVAQFPEATMDEIRQRLVDRSRYASGLENKARSAGILHLGHTLSSGPKRPPQVLSVQQDFILEADESITLAVDYIAFEKPAFQWYLNDAEITGATGSSLSLVATDKLSEGVYSVEIRTASGMERRIVADLRLSIRQPVIVSQPETVSVAPGRSFTLHVIAEGSSQLNFQWYKDGTIIEGANSAILTQTANNGQLTTVYTVEVSSRFGSVVSEPITVSFDLPADQQWRSAGQFQVDKINSSFERAGDYYWNLGQRVKTKDFIHWQVMYAGLARNPTYANGLYWSMNSAHQLLRSENGIDWEMLAHVQFNRSSRLAVGNGVLLAYAGLNDQSLPQMHIVSLSTMELTTVPLPTRIDRLIYDGQHFWVNFHQTQFKSTNGIDWQEDSLGGKILWHFDSMSGHYIALWYTEENFVTISHLAYSTDLQHWTEMDVFANGSDMNRLRIGSGVISNLQNSWVLSTGEVRSVVFNPWVTWLYETEDIRVMRHNDVLTVTQLATNEISEIFHSEVPSGSYYIAGDSVYILRSNRLYEWHPTDGLLEIQGLPANSALVTNSIFTFADHLYFRTQNNEYFRLTAGHRHVVRFNYPSDRPLSSGNGVIRWFDSMGNFHWSVDAIHWHYEELGTTVIHTNGKVLGVPNSISFAQPELRVKSWNFDNNQWSEGIVLEPMAGQFSGNVYTAATSERFAILVGNRAFFSTDGDNWEWFDLNDFQPNGISVRENVFLFTRSGGNSALTKDGTSWSEGNPATMALHRTSWLSVSPQSLIAGADGMRLPQPPVVTVSGGRTQSSPATWSVTASVDVPQSHLYTQLKINGSIVERKSGARPTFQIRQRLPGQLQVELISIYANGLVLSSGGIDLMASFQVQSEQQSVFTLENGTPQVLPAPGVRYFKVADRVLAYDVADKRLRQTIDGIEWTNLPGLNVTGPDIFAPTTLQDGTVIIPFNRHFSSLTSGPVAVLISAETGELTEIASPRSNPVEYDFISVNERAFLLFCGWGFV
ncbi:MAG: S8 family serine peptidase [Verrucomicrobia bacterium]|nr:S8 family serine peptidase [Verrucomicrobiota bacterium]